MEDVFGDTDLKRLTRRSLNVIGGSTSIYCSILNSPKWLHMTNQENELASVLGDIDSDRLGGNEDRKKRKMESEDHRKNKS